MSNKEMVIDLLQKLPEETSLEQIAQEIEFIAGIRQGITELDRGEFISEGQLREQLHAWTTSNALRVIFPKADPADLPHVYRVQRRPRFTSFGRKNRAV